MTLNDVIFPATFRTSGGDDATVVEQVAENKFLGYVGVYAARSCIWDKTGNLVQGGWASRDKLTRLTGQLMQNFTYMGEPLPFKCTTDTHREATVLAVIQKKGKEFLAVKIESVKGSDVLGLWNFDGTPCQAKHPTLKKWGKMKPNFEPNSRK